MSEAEAQSQLADFAPVFRAAEACGIDPLVVGGHAANFWAYYLEKEEPELDSFQPFTSKDLDLLGNRQDFLCLVRQLKAEAREMKRVAPTPVIGTIQFATATGARTQVDVLFSLYGTSLQELRDGAFHLRLPELGFTVHVPSPLACLKAKTNNVVGLSQETRPDIKHVRMLKLCNRALLRRALKAMARGEIGERAGINALEAVYRFSQSPQVAQASEKFPFDWSRCFPFPELVASNSERVGRFVERRLGVSFPDQCRAARIGKSPSP